MSDISDRRTDLPPRAIGVPDTGQGLFQKFEVRRTDGSSEPGGKHEGCEYFVLDTDHDPFAPAALRAYADACEATHPLLARDLRERYPLGQREERTYVLVPILERFDQTKPIGWVKVLRAALPPTPDWCFNIGYKVLQGKPAASGRLQVTGYLLQSVSITSDAEYERVIDRENGRLLTEPTEHVVQALRERAIGIARDVADAFAKRRNDGSSTETLFVRLADELLREPELLKAIAAWHAAALQQVDGGQPQAAQPEAPAELRGLDTATRVRFYEHDFYVLSNFSAFALYWRGLRFDTSEAAYHWEKFTDSDGALVDVAAIRQAILTAASAHEAFKIAEKNKAHRRPDWDDVKVGIMLDILRAKAAQHEYVRRKLLATGDRELVEDSWRDDFWGWGPNRDGKNMLGRLWMQVRAEIRDSATPPTPPTEPAAVGELPPLLNFDQLQSVMAAHFGGRELTDDEADSAESFARAVERAVRAAIASAPHAPQARPAWEDASATERTHARRLLHRHCSLEVRATLSAHQEEWWRLNREREASEVDLLQVLATGLQARRVESDRKPAAGMNLSQEKRRSTGLGPVVIAETAKWAGATWDTDGRWGFSMEAWQKFTTSLSADQPMEILTSPGVSAPESVVHQRCMTGGCQMPANCPQGKCVLGPGEQA